MQRCDAAKPFYLENRKVADTDGADLSLLEQCEHGFRGFFDRNQRIGPVHLIDVDVIGSKPAERILNLLQDAGAAGVARYFPAIPLESRLGRNQHLRAQPAFGDRLADDLFGAAKSVDRSSVDNIDAMLECAPDGGDGFGFVGAAPHPPADRPRTDGDRRYLERSAGNMGELHFRTENFCVTNHDPVPFFSARPLRRLSYVQPQSSTADDGTA